MALPAGPRLTARPATPTGTINAGEQPLALSTEGRDGLLYIPAGYVASKPAPLVLMRPYGLAGKTPCKAMQKLTTR